MNIVKTCTLVTALCLLSACAAEQEVVRRMPTDAEVEQYNASVAVENHIVCRYEIAVGTNIPKRKCRRVEDVQITSDFHREQLIRVLR